MIVNGDEGSSTLDPCEKIDQVTDSIDWCACKYPIDSVTPNFIKYAWDPRCRSWFMNSMRTTDKTIISSPYMSEFGNLVYITFSRFLQVGPGNDDAVSAVDINLHWSIYKTVLRDISFLDHYFIVDLAGNVI